MATSDKVFAALVLALTLHTMRADAWCAVVVGTSSPFGPALQCGEFFTQLERNTTLHLKKLNIYLKNGCISGLKTQFGYKSANSQLFGQALGTEKSISLGDSEFVTGVEIKENATCITYLKFNTGKGQKLELGNAPGTKVTKPRPDAYVFGFAGSALGDCPVPLGQLTFIWAVEDCTRALPRTPEYLITQEEPSIANPSEPPDFLSPNQEPTMPNPTQNPVYPNPTRPPVDVEPPVRIPVMVPTPMPIPVPVPTPINITIPQYQVINISVPIPVPVPTPVDVPNPVPVPNPVNVPTPVPNPVPTPVPIPTYIPIPTPVPVGGPPGSITNVQIQVPGSPPGTLTPVTAICDVDQDLLVFSAASSVKCVFDHVGAQVGRVDVSATAATGRFAQYAGVECYDLGCQQIMQPAAPAPAPAPVTTHGKTGGVEVLTEPYSSYESLELDNAESGNWNGHNSYMMHGRRRLTGWNPFAAKAKVVKSLFKEKESQVVYVPVPVPVTVQVPVHVPALAPPQEALTAKCSFAICIPKEDQQQQLQQQQPGQQHVMPGYQDMQQLQQEQIAQQVQQWRQQQQQQSWQGAQGIVVDDPGDMQMAAAANMRATG